MVKLDSTCIKTTKIAYKVRDKKKKIKNMKKKHHFIGEVNVLALMIGEVDRIY